MRNLCLAISGLAVLLVPVAKAGADTTVSTFAGNPQRHPGRCPWRTTFGYCCHSSVMSHVSDTMG